MPGHGSVRRPFGRPVDGLIGSRRDREAGTSRTGRVHSPRSFASEFPRVFGVAAVPSLRPNRDPSRR